MKTATLTRPTDPKTASLGAGTMSVAGHDLGSPPDEALRGAAETNNSIRKASATAGVGLLAMSVLSAFGYLVAVKGLVVPTSAARTARNITGHEGLFRFGILSLYVVAALDVVVAWALYRVFKPVSRAVSRLAAWLRIAYAGVFVVGISQLVGATRLHAQALQLINTFTNIWDAGLVLFGLNLFVLAYLAYRSGYVPKLLGVLLALLASAMSSTPSSGCSSEAPRLMSPRSRAWVSSCSHFGLFSGDAASHCAAPKPTTTRLEQPDDREE